MSEITLEITNYCPHDCKFCSSNATTDLEEAIFLPVRKIREILGDNKYDHIILSGGEPLSHPQFWDILQLCKQHTKDVVLYSNEITHLIYNPHVIDGVYLEANITITPETDKIHILKRVKQGREASRPEVHLSRNFCEECSCEHSVVRPTGKITRSPCDKWNEVEGE